MEPNSSVGSTDFDCSSAEHSDSYKPGNSFNHCLVGLLKNISKRSKFRFDSHLVADEPESRPPLLDEVSEKFWNGVLEKLENTGEDGRDIDADLLMEGGWSGDGGVLLLYSCSRTSLPVSSLQVLVSVGTSGLPLHRPDSSSSFFLSSLFFFRSPTS